MARQATGIDVGSRSAILLRGHPKGNTFVVTEFAVEPCAAAEARDAWARLDPGFKLGRARVGLSGRDVNIRYTQVPRLPDWQLRNLMRFEVAEIGDQSGSAVASDFNVLPELPEVEGEDVVLLAMARESLLEEHLEGLQAAGGSLDAFTPNPVALYNAWLFYGVVEDDTVMVANIGHDNLDVILVRGTDLLFARNLTGGSVLVDQAIAERLGVSMEKAEEIKRKLVNLEPGAAHASPQEEKASRAAVSAAGQILSLLQSAVLFCKSQIRLSGLQVDRLALCGGGARLRGLDQYLAQGMRVRAERFDPFRVVDTQALGEEAQAELATHHLAAVVALGLATTGANPNAYSVEVLPGRVAKKREFWGGTAFLIGAAALLLACLVLVGVRLSGDLERTGVEVTRLERELSQKESAHGATTELLEENEALEALALELWTLAGAGEQMARGLDAFHASLPADFWITKLVTRTAADEELGIERGAERPLLLVEGSAREGSDAPHVQWDGFVRAVADRVEGVSLKEQLTPDGQAFALSLSLFAPEEDEGERGYEDEAFEAGEEG